ncbi:MAG: S41 family peptidase [Faecousia sp.]
MKTFLRALSYLTTALAACALTLYFYPGNVSGVSKLDQVEYLIENRFIGEVDLKKAEDAAAAAMVDALGDRWSYYLSAEDYADHKEQVNNAYVGIGVTITADESGEGYLIIEVQPGGSAYEVGILPGDVIVSAQGQSAKGITVSELRDLIRGPEGTTVPLEVLRDEETLSFQVERRQILTPVVSSQMLEGNIGLIAIHNFDSRCAQESIAAIEQLRQQGATALIFDVRYNPGGYATELVELLDYLLPEGELFRTVDYSGKEQVDYSDAACLDIPFAVVCNQDSYSAAEFFPAAIQEYGAGTVVGTPTCGKGYFQYTYQLSDGSGIGLSVGKYFTPSGKSLTDVGVQPDVLVEVDVETEKAIYYGTLEPQDDPQIMAAVEILVK